MTTAPITEYDAFRVAVLDGFELSAARYWCLEPEPVFCTGGSARSHEVSVVDLESPGGDLLRVTWAQVGLQEGLTLELNPEDRFVPGLHQLDATMVDPWDRVSNTRVDALRTSWHRTDSMATLWSVGLNFVNGVRATVALGEVAGASLSYVPDALVVIPSEELAAAYEIPASATSAFGTLWPDR